MPRVVIDTSTLVSYALTRGDLTSRVVARWRAGDFVLLSSRATRQKLASVLRRPAILTLAVAPLDEMVLGLERFSEDVAEEAGLTGLCRDVKDDQFLVCAIAGAAHYLVASDQDPLSMRYCRGVAIVNPGQFLLALELRPLGEQHMVERFSREMLARILENVPLEPGTQERLRRALGGQGLP